MSDEEKQLASFMAKYDPPIGRLTRAIRAKMRRLYPTALELVYDNYNALAIGYGPTEKSSEAIFSIAVFPRWVSLFFLQARGLRDASNILKGSGNVARHIVLPSAAHLDQPAVRELMEQAEALAKVPLGENGKHRLVIKSISKVQRPRRPAEDKASSRPKPKTRRTTTASANK